MSIAVDNRITALERRLDEGFDGLEVRPRRGDDINARLLKLEAEIARLSRQVDVTRQSAERTYAEVRARRRPGRPPKVAA